MSSLGPDSAGASGGNGNGPFPRIPSESSLVRKEGNRATVPGPSKPWERSQSALDLENKEKFRYQTASSENVVEGGKVSEQSRVYWDLSKAPEDEMAGRGGGKFKISLQTIHQKEEMKAGSRPNVSVQARVVRRMASETALLPGRNHQYEYCSEVHHNNVTLPGLPSPGSPPKQECPSGHTTPSPSASQAQAQFSFSFNHSKPNLSVTLANAVPVMQNNIKKLEDAPLPEQCHALREMLDMIQAAWGTPTIGRDLAYGLCDVLRTDGGLEILIKNCNASNYEIKLGSAKVLEQSLTVNNRDVVASEGLDVMVKLVSQAKDDLELTKAATGILENLFKHSEETCEKVIQLGGLNSLLYCCRYSDILTLRHCAIALANLAIYGGAENQSEMIEHKVPEWLFPLAFSNDDSVRYYAFLAISALSANKELESAVVKSGTLELVKPFVLTHDPVKFAHSDKAHLHGQSKEWLKRFVTLLDSQREEAQCLAAFHFAMEAGIKAESGKLEVHPTYGVEVLTQHCQIPPSRHKPSF